MERNDFLKGLGVPGIGSMLRFYKTTAAAIQFNKALLPANTCAIITTETPVRIVVSLKMKTEFLVSAKC